MRQNHHPSTVATLRASGAQVLRANAVESAALDTDVLLAHVLRRDRAYLLSHGEELVPQAMVRSFHALLERRLHGEPVAYLVGMKEFYGLEFTVNPHVLIPRPKTEGMVERTKEILTRWNLAETLVIDVGTGSGILAITVKRLLPRVTVLAIDHSKRALRVAMENAERLGIPVIKYSSNQVLKGEEAIHFLHSDLLSKISKVPFGTILVLANLPYVPTQEIATLEKDVKDFEPAKALDGGEDGLDLFRRLARQVRRKFRGKNVRVLWECDEEQEADVASLFSDFG